MEEIFDLNYQQYCVWSWTLFEIPISEANEVWAIVNSNYQQHCVWSLALLVSLIALAQW
jgi:hypothetical protein